MSVEGRLTVSNMSIEGGARAGLIAPDEKTFAYLKGRKRAPKGELWEKAVDYWRTLPTDQGATYDRVVTLDAAEIAQLVSWGPRTEDGIPVRGAVPDQHRFAEPSKQEP